MPSGIAVIDKPAGWTSHQVVGRIRRLAGTRKVGHAGTLDPMATGVLVVGINRGTRLLGHLMRSEKEYAATIRLGVSTLTDDAEGEVTARLGARGFSETELAQRLARLTGDIEQVPTAVSAIKVAGVRAYARVRAGEQVELPPRPVTVSRFEATATRESVVDGAPVVDLDVLVRCSSGTYIRALARDLGAALGTGGHLTRLRRTRVGSYGVQSAQTLEEAEAGLVVTDLARVAADTFPVVRLDEQRAMWVRNGRRLEDYRLGADRAAVFSPAGELLALYRQDGTAAVAECVFTG